MGCATFIFVLASGLYFYAERPGLAGAWSPPYRCSLRQDFFAGFRSLGSRTTRNVPQPAGRDKKTEEQKTVISEMHQIAGRDSSCPRTNPGQENAHPNQQADLSPAAPQLLRVHRSEQDARYEYTGADAETARDNRIQEAPEHRFFHQWGHQDAEAHQQNHGRPRMEHFLDGQF